MADKRWVGAAQPIAQVETITIGGTYSAGEDITVTINNKSINLIIGATTTTAQIATELTSAWNNDENTALGTDYIASERGPNIPEFAEITAAASGSTVVLTGDTKGKPFTVTVAENSASGTIGTATTTAATGPNHWNNIYNWDTGAVPVSTDDVFFDNSNISVLYGLAQSAVTLTSLNIAASYTGDIGLPKINSDSTEYVEYRADYLAISATTLNIGLGSGTGSSRIKINLGSNASTINVFGTGSSAESNLQTVLLKGTHVDNALNARSNSSIGLAVFGGETAVIAGADVSGSGEVFFGEGVTLTTLEMNGFDVTVNNGMTTANQFGGNLTVEAGAVTTLNCRGGTAVYNSIGTLGTALVADTGFLDFSQDPRAKTVTNPVELYGPNSRIADPESTVSNLRVDFNESAESSQVSWGRNIRLTRGAVS